MTGDAGTWVIIVLELVGALGIAGFWVMWLSTEHTEEWLPEGYIDHETPFVWSDSVLAALLTTSAILLMLEEPLGESLALVAGGMLLFLGILDTAYFARVGMFARAKDGIANAAVVIGVLTLGLILVVRFA